jgi:hypothetical protein
MGIRLLVAAIVSLPAAVRCASIGWSRPESALSYWCERGALQCANHPAVASAKSAAASSAPSCLR